jgi:hypothetical protein
MGLKMPMLYDNTFSSLFVVGAAAAQSLCETPTTA